MLSSFVIWCIIWPLFAGFVVGWHLLAVAGVAERVYLGERGGRRSPGLERETAIRLGECIICPRALVPGLTVALPAGLRPVIKGIDHSALQTCKAEVCRGNLRGDRKLVGKGARAIERIVAWENAQLRTPFRVGDVVLAKHDKSSCAWVDEDEARVSSLAYDAARRCAVLKIRYVNNPGGEVDALPHHLVPRVELGSRHAPSALNLADAVKAERFANAAATQQKRAAALATEMYDEKKRRKDREANGKSKTFRKGYKER